MPGDSARPHEFSSLSIFSGASTRATGLGSSPNLAIKFFNGIRPYAPALPSTSFPVRHWATAHSDANTSMRVGSITVKRTREISSIGEGTGFHFPP
jgi:hypothetical protein